MGVSAVVTIDKAGRIVIPKDMREAHHLHPGTKFLLVEGADGRLWLQRLDPEELARRIHEELRGVNLDPLIAKVEDEIEAFAAKRFPAAARR